MLEHTVVNLSVKIPAKMEDVVLDIIDVLACMDLLDLSVRETTEQGPASLKSPIRCVRVR